MWWLITAPILSREMQSHGSLTRDPRSLKEVSIDSSIILILLVPVSVSDVVRVRRCLKDCHDSLDTESFRDQYFTILNPDADTLDFVLPEKQFTHYDTGECLSECPSGTEFNDNGLRLYYSPTPEWEIGDGIINDWPALGEDYCIPDCQKNDLQDEDRETGENGVDTLFRFEPEQTCITQNVCANGGKFVWNQEECIDDCTATSNPAQKYHLDNQCYSQCPPGTFGFNDDPETSE